ncbi:MAG: PAS domain-containing protein, partial [Bdellovibrionales bacterium]|nr:PAS domain-containing protein [Bdellovibrionales bacterium]
MAQRDLTSSAVNFKNGHSLENEEILAGKVAAIDRAQAVIEFNLDGTIVSANQNFLNTMGYSLNEVVGQHHSLFATPEYAKSEEYKNFWEKLNRGEYDSGQYKRIGKGGKEVWIQASYNPILDKNGKPMMVVKFATDITEEKLRNAEYAGKMAAISKSQAIIEFDVEGNILTANDNFLHTMGYSLNEIEGRHHSLFATPEYANSMDYKNFWTKLKRGEYDSGQYKRIGKGGKEVWIQASYNPILDASGKPFKVVKFATDITEEKIRNADYWGQIQAIDKSQAV